MTDEEIWSGYARAEMSINTTVECVCQGADTMLALHRERWPNMLSDESTKPRLAPGAVYDAVFMYFVGNGTAPDQAHQRATHAVRTYEGEAEPGPDPVEMDLAVRCMDAGDILQRLLDHCRPDNTQDLSDAEALVWMDVDAWLDCGEKGAGE